MLKLLANWKLIAVATAFISASAFTGGWAARDAFCDAAEARRVAAQYRQRIEQLERNLERIARVTGTDAERLKNDAAELDRLENIIRENEDKIGSGVCFDANDTDRVRDLWK